MCPSLNPIIVLMFRKLDIGNRIRNTWVIGQIPCIDSSPRADRHNPMISRAGSKIAVSPSLPHITFE